MKVDEFQEIIWEKGRELFREMPWRTNTDPYYVLVSELMLQQTQVERVIPKFQEFIASYPTIKDLARAPLGEVLTHWSGLGYNRRAKFLHEAAKQLVAQYDGKLPADDAALRSLPGIGPNTAGAIRAYGFNQPSVFVETNVRTVYFHHFFADAAEPVSDKEVHDLVALTVDQEHPREWYWALMDYGSFLKKHGAGRIALSKHYKKQTPLKGSLREVRGLILKALAVKDRPANDLRRALPQDARFDIALKALVAEGLVDETDGQLHLAR